MEIRDTNADYELARSTQKSLLYSSERCSNENMLSRPNDTLCIVREGNMGDVLSTEPIARALKNTYKYVALCTELPHVAALLEVYDEVISYDAFSEHRLGHFDCVVEIEYEVYSGCHHMVGAGRCAGLDIGPEVPRVRRGAPRLVHGKYGLIAPETSHWIRAMRQWPRDRFLALRNRLETALGFPFVLLEPSHGFGQMLSLIEHTSCFVGNDSGPAILSQCFERPTFVVFGATRTDLVLLDVSAVGIQAEVGCNGCKHFARHTQIECATPICLDRLDVETVATTVINTMRNSKASNVSVRGTHLDRQ